MTRIKDDVNKPFLTKRAGYGTAQMNAFWNRVDSPSSVDTIYYSKPTLATSNGQPKNSFEFPTIDIS